MPARSTLLFLAAIAAAALLGAGCGDDSSGEPAAAGETDRSLSRAEYVDKANALCVRGQRARRRAAATYRRERSSEEDVLIIALLKEVYAPMIGEQAGELRALGAPRGDEEKVEAVLLTMEETAEALRLIESLPDADLNAANSRAEAVARAYGLDACAPRLNL